MNFAALLLLFLYQATINAKHINRSKCEEWRLPRNILPTHYDITFRIPVNAQEETFHGSLQIGITCYHETDTILLHANQLFVNTTLITLEPEKERGRVFRVEDSTIDTKRDFIRLKFQTPILKGRTYFLNIPEYIGRTVKSSGTGLFKGYDKEKRVVYNTLFEPTYARQAFPCFDEPDMKATFKVRIERSGPQKSYSNMALINTIKLSDERYIDTFNVSPLMSTYTLAIAINEYSRYPLSGTSRTSILAPDSDVKTMELMYKIADQALLKMEEYTGIPYTLNKLEHVPVPKYMVSGMENWGLITYSQGVFDDLRSSEVLAQSSAAATIVHEVAHQWFGNLVTLDWWSHMWLNEAFPTYIQHIILDEIFPELKLKDVYSLVTLRQALIKKDDGLYVVPVPLSRETLCNAEETLDFDDPSPEPYTDGATVLAMFQAILGSELRFQKAMRIFLRKNTIKNAKPKDFFKALDKINRQLAKDHLPKGVTFRDLGRQWTEQRGVPLVTVTRNYTSGEVHFKQEPYGYKSKGRWWIPLTWRTTSSSQRSLLEGPQDWFYEDKTISLNISSEDWLLTNINVTGFYRVNYDEENWSMLARGLLVSPERFPVRNRAQLLNDVIILGILKRLNFNIVWEMTKFLRYERDPVVWTLATVNLRVLHQYVLHLNPADKLQKQQYINHLVATKLESIRINQNSGLNKISPAERLLEQQLDHFLKRTRMDEAQSKRIR